MFRDDIADLMAQVAEFYNETGNPFMVNIYPFLSYYTSPNFPIQYAFFDGKSEGVNDNNGLHYSNVFDAIFDTLIAALNKTGFPNLPIVIGEIGWPTDGNVYATNNIAEKFYDGLLKKAVLKQGTPCRPKSVIDMYLFGLYDEDMKSVLPGNFERHWGIFGPDGQPKFAMDLAGTGKKQMPIAAKGLDYLPKKWCVFNPNAKDESKLNDSMNYACDRADCTALYDGASCNSLDEHGKASYAFNLYFQNMNQADQTCDFNGLAMVTTKDPSAGNCSFVIGVDTSKFPQRPKSDSESGSSSSMSGCCTLQVTLIMFAFLWLFRPLV